jgi:hypothetical protein
MYNRIHIVYTCNAYCGGEERLRNVTYLFPKFRVLKIDPLNVVSHNVSVYKNVTTTLNEDFVYFVTPSLVRSINVCSSCLVSNSRTSRHYVVCHLLQMFDPLPL